MTEKDTEKTAIYKPGEIDHNLDNSLTHYLMHSFNNATGIILGLQILHEQDRCHCCPPSYRIII